MKRKLRSYKYNLDKNLRIFFYILIIKSSNHKFDLHDFSFMIDHVKKCLIYSFYYDWSCTIFIMCQIFIKESYNKD